MDCVSEPTVTHIVCHTVVASHGRRVIGTRTGTSHGGWSWPCACTLCHPPVNGDPTHRAHRQRPRICLSALGCCILGCVVRCDTSHALPNDAHTIHTLSDQEDADGISASVRCDIEGHGPDALSCDPTCAETTAAFPIVSMVRHSWATQCWATFRSYPTIQVHTTQSCFHVTR